MRKGFPKIKRQKWRMRAANSERSLRLQLARSQYYGQCGGRNKRRKMLQSRHAQDIARGSSSKFDGVGNTTYCALAGRRSRPEPRWVRRLPRSVMQTNASGTRAAREWATRPTDARKRCAGQCNASVMLENATQALCWKMQRACVAAPTAPRKAELASGAGWALQRMNMV